MSLHIYIMDIDGDIEIQGARERDRDRESSLHKREYCGARVDEVIMQTS